MRSKISPNRVLSPDPVYHHPLVTKLINRLMLSGNKAVSRRLVYQAFQKVAQATDQNPVSVFDQAVANIGPQMEVRPRRIGGAAYQVPYPVHGNRKESLAIRWLIESARQRPNSQYHTMSEKLSAEIIDAANQTGLAIKKKLDTHRMAEANKAFAHFRW